MQPNRLVFSVLSLLLLASCRNKKNEDITESVNKAGSVETAVTVEHADSTHDILITKHRVWNNFTAYKTIEYRDTIPALGNTTTTAENKDGKTKQVTIKKEYEIFITVK